MLGESNEPGLLIRGQVNCAAGSWNLMPIVVIAKEGKLITTSLD